MGINHAAAKEAVLSILAIVQRSLLIGRDLRRISLALHLLLEIGLGRFYQLRIGKKIGCGQRQRLGGNQHATLADAHPRASRGLPTVRRDTWDKGGCAEADGGHVPTNIADIG